MAQKKVLVLNGGLTQQQQSADQLIISDSTNPALPALSFVGDPNTGIYNPAADTVSVSTNGTLRLSVDTAAVTSTLPVVVPVGSASAPSLTFTGDTNTGISAATADTLVLSTNGTARLTLANALATFSTELSMSNNKITNLATPTADTDAVNKLYADSISAGLDPKESVRTATVTGNNVPGYAVSPNNGTFTVPNNNATFFPNAGQPIEINGITLANGNRVLVKNQTDPLQNGIYVVTDAGVEGTTDAVLTRAPDQDGTPAAEVSGGNFTFVEAGTVGAGSGWVVVWDGIVTLNTDPVDWTQFSDVAGNFLQDPGGNGVVVRTSLNTTTNRTITGTTNRISLTNGDGVAGNPTIDIAATYVGQTSITTLGTITTGVWNGTTIAIANGGTGQTTATDAFDALAPTTTAGDLIYHNGTDNVRLGIGTSGFVLSSTGSAPQWTDPDTLVSQPANQIVYGTGTALGSDADFTYIASTGQFYVNTINGTTGSVSSATPGTIAVFGVNGTGTSGGDVVVKAGAGDTGNGGGNIQITSGTGDAGSGFVAIASGSDNTGDTGAVGITTGSTSTGAAGNISLQAGNSGSTNNVGGGVVINAGGGDGTAAGGAIQLTAGFSGATGVGGAITLLGGSSTASTGGGVSVTAGPGGTTGAGGALTLSGGVGGATGAGGATTISGGDGGGTSGDGGAVTVQGGTATDGNGGSVAIAGRNGVGTNRNGGSVTVTAGTATGSGTAGSVRITTGGTERLEILGNGAWEVNSSTGSAGQVLTSNGSGSSPTWQANNATTAAAITVTLTNNEASPITVGQAVYTNAAGQVMLADANSDPDATKTIGLVYDASIAASGSGAIITHGVLGGLTGLTAGALYYLSETAGDITSTAPSTGGSWIVPIGIALSTTQLKVNILSPIQN